jgi:PAS domain S-box-containing protein
MASGGCAVPPSLPLRPHAGCRCGRAAGPGDALFEFARGKTSGEVRPQTDVPFMQLKFDWLIVLENLRRGIVVTDVNLEPPHGPRIIYVNRAWVKMTGYDRHEATGKTPRILQGKHTDRAVLRRLKANLQAREVFQGQTWNYRKNGQPFMMNWFCYPIFGERGKPIYFVAEQEDVTELETYRMKEKLLADPHDPEAAQFFAVLKEH